MNYRFYTFDEPILNFFFSSTTLYIDERKMYAKNFIRFMYYDKDKKNHEDILNDEEVTDGYYELKKNAIMLAQLGLLEYVTEDNRVVGYKATCDFYRRTLCLNTGYADKYTDEVIECSDYVQRQLEAWSRLKNR